ncbi:unnamed protein product [Fraxinus pennsylvanica]|uniref:Uncharacterized protein n=1 Tax=Fraxinus pennsylvanica TaxID=56036 RepID=A0AAD2E6W8_9LAMI|nr:unnamed protein product [Fraxinus pennsylvanica]
MISLSRFLSLFENLEQLWHLDYRVGVEIRVPNRSISSRMIFFVHMKISAIRMGNNGNHPEPSFGNNLTKIISRFLDTFSVFLRASAVGWSWDGSAIDGLKVQQVKPDVLLGLSAVGGLFSKEKKELEAELVNVTGTAEPIRKIRLTVPSWNRYDAEHQGCKCILVCRGSNVYIVASSYFLFMIQQRSRRFRYVSSCHLLRLL